MHGMTRFSAQALHKLESAREEKQGGKGGRTYSSDDFFID